ncbi:hypothetical protein NA57DRAFT_59175 [Rhizodiscina lignyota]|uniref:Clr5 domain-containing protein n=1 Tax=Rhizodiscina lignyota TaxID=1504668 RepID=A0A9P4M2X3_9PEZI|nr:hypothetical protein NA57DRAFT_59175 [Rhizodiscina lignyota]
MASSLKDFEWVTQPKKYAERHHEQKWEDFKEELRQFYLVEHQTLAAIIEHMEKVHQFIATKYNASTRSPAVNDQVCSTRLEQPKVHEDTSCRGPHSYSTATEIQQCRMKSQEPLDHGDSARFHEISESATGEHVKRQHSLGESYSAPRKRVRHAPDNICSLNWNELASDTGAAETQNEEEYVHQVERPSDDQNCSGLCHFEERQISGPLTQDNDPMQTCLTISAEARDHTDDFSLDHLCEIKHAADFFTVMQEPREAFTLYVLLLRHFATSVSCSLCSRKDKIRIWLILCCARTASEESHWTIVKHLLQQYTDGARIKRTVISRGPRDIAYEPYDIYRLRTPLSHSLSELLRTHASLRPTEPHVNHVHIFIFHMLLAEIFSRENNDEGMTSHIEKERIFAIYSSVKMDTDFEAVWLSILYYDFTRALGIRTAIDDTWIYNTGSYTKIKTHGEVPDGFRMCLLWCTSQLDDIRTVLQIEQEFERNRRGDEEDVSRAIFLVLWTRFLRHREGYWSTELLSLSARFLSSYVYSMFVGADSQFESNAAHLFLRSDGYEPDDGVQVGLGYTMDRTVLVDKKLGLYEKAFMVKVLQSNAFGVQCWPAMVVQYLWGDLNRQTSRLPRGFPREMFKRETKIQQSTEEEALVLRSTSYRTSPSTLRNSGISSFRRLAQSVRNLKSDSKAEQPSSVLKEAARLG